MNGSLNEQHGMNRVEIDVCSNKMQQTPSFILQAAAFICIYIYIYYIYTHMQIKENPSE